MKRGRWLPWFLLVAAIAGGAYLVDHYFIGPYRTDCYVNFERGRDPSSEKVESILRAFHYDVDVLERPAADRAHTPSLLVTTGANDDEERELDLLIGAVLEQFPGGNLEGHQCRQRPFFD
jgi:hypothetical protein